ncbi:spirocyclase AveC family protein [Mycolicibacter kumamotonensis]|uniref:Spirocyclase, AveC family n=1 Tax=Mycolicibacter kumamotonensis TaxID=354243 RepID=A0A7K3L6R0_9MYCO|nr:hypothetical protein [Mycolicibacter kumamotonensis]NDJ87942.1 hypothetical protein [Mycolicibacter kumamotonensis]
MTHTHVEPWSGAPPLLWFIEAVLPAIWLAVLLWLAWRSTRLRRATFGLLILLSFSTLFWQDAYINWGMYLLYNPNQTLMPWGSTLFTAPRKVWWTIFAYGIFWLVSIPAALGAAAALRRHAPAVNRTVSIIVTGVPLFYVWDLLFEGMAVRGGFYSYVDYWGPAIVMESGNMPLVFPILFIAACGAGFVWLLSWQTVDGHAGFERWFRLDRVAAGWRRETSRIGGWIVLINAAHIVFCIVPLVAIRLLLLEPSQLVP